MIMKTRTIDRYGNERIDNVLTGNVYLIMGVTPKYFVNLKEFMLREFDTYHPKWKYRS